MNAAPRVLAALLVLTACNAGSDKDEALASAQVVAAEAGPSEYAADAEDDSRADEASTPAPRMVICNASLRLRAEAPQAVAAATAHLADQFGGFVASSDTQGVGQDVQQVDTTLRIPAAQFEPVLARLRAQGELLQETVTGQDVTAQHADIDARLRTQRVLEQRLLSILEAVESVEDALAVETQLVGVRTEIERLEARVRTMEDQVAMATISLVVEAPHRASLVPAETVGSRLQRAVDDAGRLFVGGLAGLIRMVGALLPLGLVFGPLGLLARGWWRRRRRQHALMAAATGRPPGV